MAERVLDVDNVERSRMALTVDDRADSPQVTASRDHAQVARVELDVIHDLSSADVHLDGVVHLDQGIRVADRTAVVGRQERNSLGSGLDTADLAQLVLK